MENVHKQWAFFIALSVVVLFYLESGSCFESKRVLVLGSGGFIGSYLTAQLRNEGHEVLEVRNRQHVDLRKQDALLQFEDDNLDFVFFLACEVGGSKFIDSSQEEKQRIILRHNLHIYNTVFPFLEKQDIPFIFTSSYLSVEDSAYGAVKRVGEAWARTLKKGIITRFWNVYGAEEKIGLKSHVVADWCHTCVERGHVRALTTGEERRQFLHVKDAVAALIHLMNMGTSAPRVCDVSTGEWVAIRDLASTLEKVSEETCTVALGTQEASHRRELHPDIPAALLAMWKPTITLEEGLQDALQFYSRKLTMTEEPSDVLNDKSEL